MRDPERLKAALAHYGQTIQSKGWRAGEPIIRHYERELHDFRRWAHALGIMLRAEEILAGLAQQ